MEDLLQSQIKKSCELALPNGLKELMWDISREVLRSQPQDIYDFITKYLSVLLVTRENLSIAAKVCDEMCRGPCQLVLEDELRIIGLNDGDVLRATTIIMEHLEGAVSESNLLLKLMRTTNINEDMLPALQEAIRAAFVQHHGQKMRVPSDCEDEVREAATHTLRLYETTTPSNEEYNRMATRIQAAYRAYGVRRSLCLNKNENKAKSSEIKDKTLKIKDVNAHVEIKEPEKIKSSKNNFRASVTTESSSSLAGSYVKLPKYIPYSAHDVHDTDEEILEKVHSHTHMEDETDESEDLYVEEKVKERKTTVSFEALMIKDDVLEADDESEGIVEELFNAEGDDLEEVLSEVIAAESDIDLFETQECEIEEIMSEDKYEHLDSVSYFE